MWDFLLHLGTFPDVSIPLICPPPAAGQPASPNGFYEMATITAAFFRAAIASALIVVLAVVLVYAVPKATTGARAVRQWYLGLFLTAVACASASFTLLYFAPTTALAGSCETDPSNFLARMPADVLISRTTAGFGWAILAYVVLSLALTQSVGRYPALRNGFFHRRGVPWPRMLP